MTPTTLLLVFFVFTLAAVALAGYVVMRPSRESATSEATVNLGPSVLNQPDLPAAQAAVLEIFRVIGEAVPEVLARRKEARNQLLQAGYRWPSAVPSFIGIKATFAITFGLGCVWAAAIFGGDDASYLLPAVCGLGFGFLVPDRVLERIARSRGERMRRGLAPALDLMLLSVESGQGLDAAIQDTSRGLRATQPDLASEFLQLHLEMRAEASRAEAFRSFAKRTQDPEMKKFASLLIDTDRFGSSLGPALRGHAHYLRLRLRQGAQERARKVAVKLIFPVFFLIFPSVILVTLGPAVIMVTQQLSQMLGEF